MFQARRNPDGSITRPILPEDGALPPGVSVDGEITVHPGDDNYDEAERYLRSTTDPFGPPAATADSEEQP